MIYLGADHRGYKLKKKISKLLIDMEKEFEDLGAHEYDPSDDYPVFASRVASIVADNKNALGILMCGSGVGVDVVANKFDGVRASVAKSPAQIMAGRRDDDMNVLVIASDFTKEDEAVKMVKAFLNTKFDKAPRHKKRLAQISHIEDNN